MRAKAEARLNATPARTPVSSSGVELPMENIADRRPKSTTCGHPGRCRVCVPNVVRLFVAVPITGANSSFRSERPTLRTQKTDRCSADGSFTPTVISPPIVRLRARGLTKKAILFYPSFALSHVVEWNSVFDKQ